MKKEIRYSKPILLYIKLYKLQNPDYSFATEKWGHNVSIIANTHLTRRSRIQIEEFRTAIPNNENDIPRNI